MVPVRVAIRLVPLLDLTTTLDPRFHIAYRFGSIFLAESPPGGPGRPDLAIELLEKALRERPDRWEYMQDIGFVHYWWTHDYKAASEWLRRRARFPAPRGFSIPGGHDLGRGRRSPVFAPALGVDLAVGGNRMAPERSRTPAGPADRPRPSRSAPDNRRSGGRARRPSPTDWAPVVRAMRWRESPNDRMAPHTKSTPPAV